MSDGAPVADPLGDSRSDGIVEIRPFRPDDVDRHVAGEDDETRRWFHFPRASTWADAEAFMARSAHAFRAGGPRRSFAVVEVATDSLCGHVEANHLGEGVANVSYSIYPRFRRRGYAVRAVRLCVAYVADALPVEHIVIRTEPANTASVRVAEACGFGIRGLHWEDGRPHWDFGLDLVSAPHPSVGTGPAAQAHPMPRGPAPTVAVSTAAVGVAVSDDVVSGAVSSAVAACAKGDPVTARRFGLAVVREATAVGSLIRDAPLATTIVLPDVLMRLPEDVSRVEARLDDLARCCEGVLAAADLYERMAVLYDPARVVRARPLP